MGNQPLLQAELQRGIGEAMVGMKEYDKADEAYASAVGLFLRLNRPRDAAFVLLDRIQIAEDLLSNTERADALLLELDRVYPDHLADDEFMAGFLTAKMYLAFLRDNTALNPALVEEARPYVDRALRQSMSSRSIYTIRLLAFMESAIDQDQEAFDRLSSLIARMDPTSLEHPADMQGVINDLATYEFETGRYRSSKERFEKAYASCEELLNPRGNECATTRTHYIDTLLRLGYSKEAFNTLQLPVGQNDASNLHFEAIFDAYRVLSRNSNLHLFPTVTDAVSKFEGSTDSKKPVSMNRIVLSLAKIRHALQEGKIEVASALLNQTQAWFKSTSQDVWRVRREIRIYQGLIAQAKGNYDTAQQLLQQAVDENAKHLGRDHPLTLLVSVHLVRTLRATNQSDAALALLEHAIPLLKEAMGEKAPNFLKILAMREELISTNHMPADAKAKIDIFL